MTLYAMRPVTNAAEIRAHYEALLYNYELAHMEDIPPDYLDTESDEIAPS